MSKCILSDTVRTDTV
uniref:Uncharacterized protein n=1 Tax=Anguilla anguilla TaxID=7936 RepID=A0A0E9S8C5_ANGAN